MTPLPQSLPPLRRMKVSNASTALSAKSWYAKEPEPRA